MQLSRTSAAALQSILERLQRKPLTYTPAGVTLHPQARMEQHTVLLGSGGATFERASLALRDFATHQSDWLRLFPDDSPPDQGQTVLIVLRWLGWGVVFGCRMVRVIREPRRSGFAYGSLPGHPERGEELFLVEWHADDRVTFTLRAVSQPSNLFYKLTRPAGRWLRFLGTRQYMRAMQQAATGKIKTR